MSEIDVRRSIVVYEDDNCAASRYGDRSLRIDGHSSLAVCIVNRLLFDSLILRDSKSITKPAQEYGAY